MGGWQILRIGFECFVLFLFKEMGILHGTSSYVKGRVLWSVKRVYVKILLKKQNSI